MVVVIELEIAQAQKLGPNAIEEVFLGAEIIEHAILVGPFPVLYIYGLR